MVCIDEMLGQDKLRIQVGLSLTQSECQPSKGLKDGSKEGVRQRLISFRMYFDCWLFVSARRSALYVNTCAL